MSRDKLLELIDTEIDYNYYVSLFIGNTCDRLPEKNKINVEMISKLGKALREIKAKPKRHKLFTELSDSIREMCLSFTPILDNPEFLNIWTRLLNLALK